MGAAKSMQDQNGRCGPCAQPRFRRGRIASDNFPQATNCSIAGESELRKASRTPVATPWSYATAATGTQGVREGSESDPSLTPITFQSR